jgi:hypothetical protein
LIGLKIVLLGHGDPSLVNIDRVFAGKYSTRPLVYSRPSTVLPSATIAAMNSAIAVLPPPVLPVME